MLSAKSSDMINFDLLQGHQRYEIGEKMMLRGTLRGCGVTSYIRRELKLTRTGNYRLYRQSVQYSSPILLNMRLYGCVAVRAEEAAGSWKHHRRERSIGVSNIKPIIHRIVHYLIEPHAVRQRSLQEATRS